MKIAIVGTGYVGLVSGACYADEGIETTCVDIDSNKIEQLKEGIVPFYESRLSEMVQSGLNSKMLSFTTKLSDVIDNVDIVFSAVGTPPDKDDSADLTAVLAVASEFGKLINKYTIFVNKSTVPIGTFQKVKDIIQSELDKRNVDVTFDIVSNPEFLREGFAIEDCMYPTRTVVGSDSEHALDVMEELFNKFTYTVDAWRNLKFFRTDPASAEMIKYASNAMLATRISFMNEIANLCDKTNASVQDVANAMGMDERIGPLFLNAGCGYGGSCFPKDVKALIKICEKYDSPLNVVSAVDKANENQKHVIVNKLLSSVDDISTITKVAIIGLAFKPGTDDMREAISLTVIEDLYKNDITNISAYDPQAMFKCKELIGDKIKYCASVYEAAVDADAIIFVTEWYELINKTNLEKLSSVMNKPKIFIDGRNAFVTNDVTEHGFKYIGIGKR